MMGFLDRLFHGSPSTDAHFEHKYESLNRIGCPVHRFITITKRREDQPDETTEQQLIDTPWVQRMRRIHQLEAAWWVFPSGEHTRLQHCFGTMHLAGVFTSHLYESLSANLKRWKEPIPSKALVVETMRVAGLLHDVGHGPFGHCLDVFYFEERGLTHEKVSVKIITGPLAEDIRGLGRSPEKQLGSGEQVDPSHVAYLIQRESKERNIPLWVKRLKPLFDGPFTCDNMDFVLRDAYMCGFAVTRADVARIIDYSFFPEDADRLCLHLHGVSSLRSFLQSRLELFTSIYFHRTVRAIRLHLEDTLKDTIDHLWSGLNPNEDLEAYEEVDEWSLTSGVRKMLRQPDVDPQLASAWQAVLNRDPQWKRVYEKLFSKGKQFPEPMTEFRDRCQAKLGRQCPGCRVDIAEAPPLQSRHLVGIYNPMTHELDDDAWDRLGPSLDNPWRLVRVFSKDRTVARSVHAIMREIEGESASGGSTTNV